MEMKLGTDIVHIQRFGEKLEKNRWKFERDVFFESELLEDVSIEHLAGIFAAKEATMKALDLAPGSWKSIKVQKRPSGKPVVVLYGELAGSVERCEVSISHGGDYATATVICVL